MIHHGGFITFTGSIWALLLFLTLIQHQKQVKALCYNCPSNVSLQIRPKKRQAKRACYVKPLLIFGVLMGQTDDIYLQPYINGHLCRYFTFPLQKSIRFATRWNVNFQGWCLVLEVVTGSGSCCTIIQSYRTCVKALYPNLNAYFNPLRRLRALICGVIGSSQLAGYWTSQLNANFSGSRSVVHINIQFRRFSCAFRVWVTKCNMTVWDSTILKCIFSPSPSWGNFIRKVVAFTS